MSSAQPPSSATDLGVRQIGQIAVVVRDIDRAVRFYRDVLGLRFLFPAPPTLAFFECGGVRLMLTLPEGPEEARGTSILYYQVDDIQAAHRALVGRGVEFYNAPRLIARMPDHELWMAGFRDSEGNALELMSEVRPG